MYLFATWLMTKVNAMVVIAFAVFMHSGKPFRQEETYDAYDVCEERWNYTIVSVGMKGLFFEPRILKIGSE